ncbi:hypothetical protein [Methylobacterium frigidaeris]|uniref:Uncharacterized protein n=1 Tax=Methylobacterium frigidaeris TaxID=2038277 RepID=A0AA37M2A8_9HYPH|nr:hypothetical protein [Methylobacterium frigidaeris]PIK69325.1 hypothetical protein CS379_30415 [Methylobacterium frigidaeris]GJD60127.1 hypothetical protein MPEAHAMD_0262 [Methylobacterium frigidaeris]
MRQNGRMRKPAEVSAIGSLPGASRGYLPLLPTACVAVCLAAGSLYWREAPPRAPEGHVAVMQPLPPGSDLFRIVPEADGRVRASYPLEFEQQFPLIAGLPAEAAVPVLPPRESKPEGKAPRRAATHRPRAVPGLAVPALADLRPPARPDDLKVRKPIAETPEPTTRTASTGAEPERSAPWLPFAPTGRMVTQTVAALGDGVTHAGAAMIDLIDRRR